MKRLDHDVMSVVTSQPALKQPKVFEQNVSNFLHEHNADPHMAWDIIRKSKNWNQLRYALQENVIAHAVRDAGYDPVLGDSRGKNGPRISELFDVREQTYPSDVLNPQVHDKFLDDEQGRGILFDQEKPELLEKPKAQAEERKPIVPVMTVTKGTGTEREAEFVQRVKENGPKYVEDYLRANTRAGVPYIATDAARSLFPEYVENPTDVTDDVGKAATAVAYTVWDTLMEQGPKDGKDIVRVVTGANASGKTGAIMAGSATAQLGIDLESIIREPEYGSRLIDQMINAGFRPQINLTFTDDPRINVRRMVRRAQETGRPVRIEDMAHAFITVPKAIGALQEKYGKAIEINSFDNSADKPILHGGDVRPALDMLEEWTEPQVREAMYAELDKLRDGGEVSDALYDAARRRFNPQA